MNTYRTTKTITLACGEVGLTVAQAATRALAIEAVEAGLYRINQPVQFKIGEEIGLAGVEKPMEGSLELVPSEDQKPRRRPGRPKKQAIVE